MARGLMPGKGQGCYYPKLVVVVTVPFSPVTGLRLLVRPGAGEADAKILFKRLSHWPAKGASHPCIGYFPARKKRSG